MPSSRIVIMWENFGPQHHDRLEACATYFGERAEVIGLELAKTSSVYAWNHRLNLRFRHIVLTTEGPHFFQRSIVYQIFRLLSVCLKFPRSHFFMCHYEQPAIFITSCLLRLMGCKLSIMNDSKFDDYDRIIWREVLKSILYWPYKYALVASHRSASYLNFLGFRRDHIELNYDNLSIDRIKSLVGAGIDSAALDYEFRDFIVIARFVKKKNLFRTLEAYARYRELDSKPRRLIVIGYGELESALKAHADDLEISDHVEFTGLISPEKTMKRLNQSLALLLLSTVEQFGQVVLEAQALRIPVLVSHAVGAIDCFVRNNVNGFILDPFDSNLVARAMKKIATDRHLWNEMALAADEFSDRGDARHFAHSIDNLLRTT